jgi:ATP synthase protein I
MKRLGSGMNKLSPAFRLIGVGFYIVICIVGGVLGGLWLDGSIHTQPLFLLVGLFLGLALAFWGVYQMLKPFMGMNKGERR